VSPVRLSLAAAALCGQVCQIGERTREDKIDVSDPDL
jgi:hypothetical protein